MGYLIMAIDNEYLGNLRRRIIFDDNNELDYGIWYIKD